MTTEALFTIDFTNAAYIVAAVLFIVGLKQLGSPATARNGNRLSALAMLVAVVATIVGNDIASWEWFLGGVLVGSGSGAISARANARTLARSNRSSSESWVSGGACSRTSVMGCSLQKSEVRN